MHRARGVLIGLCLWSTPARAQSYEADSLRNVHWATVSLGYGTASLTCDTCRAFGPPSADLVLAFGGVRNAHIRAGLTLEEARSASAITNTIALSVYYYPWKQQRLFLETGIGGASVCVRGDAATGTWSGGGVALMSGAGFDVHLSPTLLFKPRVALSHASYGDLSAEDLTGTTQVSRGWRQTVWSFSAGLQWER